MGWLCSMGFAMVVYVAKEVNDTMILLSVLLLFFSSVISYLFERSEYVLGTPVHIVRDGHCIQR